MEILRSKTPLTKRKAAFLHTCAKLFEDENGKRRRVYMWTFTTRQVVEDKMAMACWHHMNRLLRKKYKDAGGCPGVRVVEDHPGPVGHPGGHGLHFHVLIARRVDVVEVRRMAIRAGFGRIHVRKCDQRAAGYLAKYLTKRDDGLRGRRRWGMVCGFKGTRVRDILVQSELAENCRRTYQVLKTWSREIFIAVNRLTCRYGHCLDWPTYPALKELPPPKEDFEASDSWVPDGVEHRIARAFGWIKLKCEETGEWYTYLVPSPVEQPF
ncbi:MAG: hypothetical protein M9920_15515 [Verrucomicrobiae bacterium]|nr:hypothetical protein [Verrucomicrobiae bacterium]